MKIVALLESMWGWRFHEPGEEAPRFFKIHPDNFSGRRLYRMCGDHPLTVTNSCRVIQSTANHHGTPDPQYVKENLDVAVGAGMDLLLICGAVAKKTYLASGFEFKSTIFMDHPAARRWTNDSINAMRDRIHIHNLKNVEPGRVNVRV